MNCFVAGFIVAVKKNSAVWKYPGRFNTPCSVRIFS